MFSFLLGVMVISIFALSLLSLRAGLKVVALLLSPTFPASIVYSFSSASDEMAFAARMVIHPARIQLYNDMVSLGEKSDWKATFQDLVGKLQG